MDRNDERERDEQRRATEQRSDERQERRPPPRRFETAPEVVQDTLDPKVLRSGRRAYRTDAEGMYEVVDWGVASIDGKCHSVKLRPLDSENTHGRKEWVSVRFVRLANEDT